MNGNIINNSQNTIQTFMEKTSSTTDIGLDLSDLYYRVAVVGSGKSAVTPITGDGENIYVGIWPSESTSGKPNSWMIVSNGKIVASGFVGYKASVTGDESEYIITVNDSSGPQTPVTKSTSSIGTYILIATITLIIIAVIVFMILFFIRKRNETGPTSGKLSRFRQKYNNIPLIS